MGDEVAMNPLRYDNYNEAFARKWDKSFPAKVVQILKPNENSNAIELGGFDLEGNANAHSNVTRYVVESTDGSDKGKRFIMRPNELNPVNEPNWCEMFHRMCYYYNLLKKFIVIAPEKEMIEYKVTTAPRLTRPKTFTVTVPNPDFGRPVGSIRLSPILVAPEDIVFSEDNIIRKGEPIPLHFRHEDGAYLTDSNGRRISLVAYTFAARLLSFWGIIQTTQVRRDESGQPITDDEGRTKVHSWNKDIGFRHLAPIWNYYPDSDDEGKVEVEIVGPHNSTREAVEFFFRPGLFSGQDVVFKKLGISHPLGL